MYQKKKVLSNILMPYREIVCSPFDINNAEKELSQVVAMLIRYHNKCKISTTNNFSDNNSDIVTNRGLIIFAPFLRAKAVPNFAPRILNIATGIP